MPLLRTDLPLIVASAKRLTKLLKAAALDESAIVSETFRLWHSLEYGPRNLDGRSWQWQPMDPAAFPNFYPNQNPLAWDDPDLAALMRRILAYSPRAWDWTAPGGEVNVAAFVALLERFIEAVKPKKPRKKPGPPSSFPKSIEYAVAQRKKAKAPKLPAIYAHCRKLYPGECKARGEVEMDLELKAFGKAVRRAERDS